MTRRARHCGWALVVAIALSSCATARSKGSDVPMKEDAGRSVAVPGGQVRTWQLGHGGGTPLIVIHGGPGFPHDYLENLGALSSDRVVVFWDQLGCGKSERPQDVTLWRLERFVDELDRVHAATVGVGQRVALLGHSWGSMLAVDYALRYPDRVATLVLDSPILSAHRFRADVQMLFDALPAGTRQTLLQHEAAHTTDSEAYNAAYGKFITRHLLRLDPFPDAVMRSMQGKGQSVYETMWGPSEFSFTGNLNSFERTELIRSVAKPVLYIVGEYDEVVPAAAKSYQELTPGAELAIIANASHLKNLEQPERYIEIVRQFLGRHNEPR